MIACKLDLLYYIQKVSYTCVLLHNHSSFCTFIVKSLVDCFFESVKLVTNKECISAINIYFELFAWRESVTNIYMYSFYFVFSYSAMACCYFYLFVCSLNIELVRPIVWTLFWIKHLKQNKKKHGKPTKKVVRYICLRSTPLSISVCTN